MPESHFHKWVEEPEWASSYPRQMFFGTPPRFPHYEIYANMSQASARRHQAPGKCPTTSISIKPHNNFLTNIMSKVKQMSTRCMKRKFMLLSSGHSPSFWLSPLSQVLSSLEVTIFEFTENLKYWVLEMYLP